MFHLKIDAVAVKPLYAFFVISVKHELSRLVRPYSKSVVHALVLQLEGAYVYVGVRGLHVRMRVNARANVHTYERLTWWSAGVVNLILNLPELGS